jgi:nucleoid DNA-binding protein
MTKAELVDHVATTVDLAKAQTEAVLTQCLQAIMDALQAGESVELRGFGRFQLRHRAARAGRNPRTGATIPIPAKAVPTFTAGPPSKSACNPAPPRRVAPCESHAWCGRGALTGCALQHCWLVHTGRPPWWVTPATPAVPGTRRRREARERSVVMAQSTALRDAAVDLQVVREFLERLSFP